MSPKNYAIKGCDILHLPPLTRTCLHPSHILYILTKFEQISRHSYHQAIFSDPVAQMKNPKKLLSEIKEIPTPLKFEKIDWLTCLKTCHKASKVK